MNPHQRARIVGDGGEHVRMLSGAPSLINYLDALNGWQLVAEASRATGRAAAASFKHVSPAGAAVAGDVDETMRRSWGLGDAEVGSLTAAYVRARDGDPRSSYGDMIAVSEPVDRELADMLGGVVSDGIIAPGYEPGVVAALSRKKGGRYVVFDVEPNYQPPRQELRTLFGITFEQDVDDLPITPDLLQPVEGGPLTPSATTDAILGMVTARYTQSNSVVYVRDGMSIGIGAGQQSRIDCTLLAGTKSRTWWLRRHPAITDLPIPATTPRQQRLNTQIATAAGTLTPDIAERTAWSQRLTDVTLVSDGYLPFRDNIDAAAQFGVATVIEPTGALQADTIAQACREHGITLARIGIRLFHH
ncbi:phosphoribosylaminoimidazolecarboxamide formyltransferase [Nocardia heshunensis]